MKITKLSREQMAFIAVAVFQCDDDASEVEICGQIGDRLGIEAVVGEGYDSTVFVCCSYLCDYGPGKKDREVRISDVMSALGLLDPELAALVINGAGSEHKVLRNALEHMGTHDSLMAKESVKTIVKQHRRIDSDKDNGGDR